MIYGFDGMAEAEGLPSAERATVAELVEIYAGHIAANAEKGRYYDQRITAGECNLGIALPSDLNNFEMACCWPEKAVTALADRSRFDGYVNANGEEMPAGVPKFQVPSPYRGGLGWGFGFRIGSVSLDFLYLYQLGDIFDTSDGLPKANGNEASFRLGYFF